MWALPLLCLVATAPRAASDGGGPAHVRAQTPHLAMNTAHEVARYRIDYGAFGQLGELQVSVAAPGADGRVRAVGSGHGALLGLGASEKRIETDFDPRSGVPAGFTMERAQDGKRVIDRVVQTSPGQLQMTRQRSDGTVDTVALSRARAVLDPVAFILRLRAAPIATTQVFDVLDGRSFWTITVAPGRAESTGGQAAIRLDLTAEPVTWEGAPDDKRQARSLALFVSSDGLRVPLRLEMPIGIARVAVELVALDRPRAHTDPPSLLSLPGRLLMPLGRRMATTP